jgi:tetratricopeptide (TPR) repeat protein
MQYKCVGKLNQKSIYLLINPLSLTFGVLSCTIATSLIFVILSVGDVIYYVQYANAAVNQTNITSAIADMVQEGNDFFNASEYTKAMTYYEQALKLDSSSVEALNGKGMVLNSLGKYQEAISLFDMALKIDPNSVQALNNKGIVLSNLGRYHEAISWFDMALKIDPNFVDSLYNKADALGELGSYDEAFIWTEKALAIDTARQNTSLSSKTLLPNQ